MDDAAPEADPTALLYVALGRLVRVLRQETDGEHVGPGGLSALFTLSRTGAVRAGALAEAEGISAPSLTRILRHLDAQGLVTRADDPADGRAQLVGLTAAGQRLIAEGLEARLTALRQRMERLDPSDRALIEAAVPAFSRLTEPSIEPRSSGVS